MAKAKRVHTGVEFPVASKLAAVQERLRGTKEDDDGISRPALVGVVAAAGDPVTGLAEWFGPCAKSQSSPLEAPGDPVYDPGMGNLRAVVTIATIAFAAACSGDGSAKPDAAVIVDAPPDAPPDAYVPDAPSYDLSCYQNVAPTTATATIQLSGTVQEAYLNGQNPALRNSMGVSIQACKGTGACTGQNNLGTTGPTPAAGTFTTAAATTGGTPLDGYLIATKTGNRTTYVYPASPLTMNQGGVPVIMLTNTLVAALAFVGINQAVGNSMLAILVTDCATPPVGIAGATVAVTQNGAPVGDAPFDASSFDPQGQGAWFITNVPPGATTVTATYNGMTFRSHVVGATADTTTTTQVKPGF